MPIKAIALDAMGVLYPVGDDLRGLIIPYLRSKGCPVSDEQIVDLFRACYRDGASAHSFIEAVACAGIGAKELEAGMLALYELRPGAIEFLEAMRDARIPVFGLSNDVAEWSLHHRQCFGIEGYFESWVVSGEVALYKPDSRIYQLVIDRLPCEPSEALFVDDSPRNLDAAAKLGLQTVRFRSERPADGLAVASFEELQAFVLGR